MKPYERMVRNGAQFLDNELGSGWSSKINIEGLDMSDPIVCILGQLYGHYDTGRKILGLSDCRNTSTVGFQMHKYGFNASQPTRLTQPWKQLLLERLDNQSILN